MRIPSSNDDLRSSPEVLLKCDSVPTGICPILFYNVSHRKGIVPASVLVWHHLEQFDSSLKESQSHQKHFCTRHLQPSALLFERPNHPPPTGEFLRQHLVKALSLFSRHARFWPGLSVALLRAISYARKTFEANIT